MYILINRKNIFKILIIAILLLIYIYIYFVVVDDVIIIKFYIKTI